MTSATVQTATRRRPPRLQAWRRWAARGIDRAAVLTHVARDGGWSVRYAFMVLMSAGIAILGLLLSSPAVIIGAMLVSPLMGPIIGLGFALAVFDWPQARRSFVALALGSALAVLFAAGVVSVSPLDSTTPEILARTRPNLFDLLVAVFSALAGAYATIRQRGETLVGVAIATALMPPLAVVGFGLATGSRSVFLGALALFGTNAVAIALSATAMAALHGFGSALSPRQTRAQAAMLLLTFAALGAPLAVALRHIAWETAATRQVRAVIEAHFGEGARVTQFEIDFAARPPVARAVVLTARYDPRARDLLGGSTARAAGGPLRLELRQIVTDQDFSRGDQDRAALAASMAADSDRDAIRSTLARVAADPSAVAVDAERRHASVRAAPGHGLEALRLLEGAVAAGHPGWTVAVIPPLAPLPVLPVAALDEGAGRLLDDHVWALRRWGVMRVTVAAAPTGPGGRAAAAANTGSAAVADALRRLNIDVEVCAAQRDRNGPGGIRVILDRPEGCVRSR